MKKRWYLVMCGVAMLAVSCQSPRIPSPPLYIFFLDVGYGDATLIVTPERHTILIDGGDVGQGANRVGPLLDDLYRNRLDYVIVTNFNPERLSGISEVLVPLGGPEGISDAAYDPGGEVQSEAFAGYLAAVGSKRRTMHLGQVIEIDGVKIECVAVNGRTESGTEFPTGRAHALRLRSEDDRSMILSVSYRDFDMLLGSDIHALSTPGFRDLESELVPVVHRVEVYKANNHASATSNGRSFLYALNPTVTIVSCGAGGKEPTNDHSVKRILDTGSKVYLTNPVEGVKITPRQGRVVKGNILVRVFDDFYTVNKDSFRFRW
jgi:competence protein ComEC